MIGGAMCFRFITLALFLGVLTSPVFAQPVPPAEVVPQQIPLKNEEAEKKGEKEEKEEKVNPIFDRLITPDRNLQRRHEQTERLIQAERYAEAGQLLGSLLEGQSDFFLAPPVDSSERTTATTFDGEILRKIEELPETGRNSYALQFQTLAQRLLTDAVQRGSLEGIQIVSQHYFPTPAGIDATFLLGMSQFEQGATGSAMFSLRKLQRKGLNVDAYEPTLSLTLATCQLRLGIHDDAKQTLERFLKRFPRPTILIGGSEPWTPQNVDELLAKLRQGMGPPPPLSDWIEQTGWLLNLGSPTQNPSTRTEKPLLELLWQIPTLGRADNSSEARLLQTVVRRSGDVYLPAGQPLVVDQRLILRGMYETTAIDVRTGKRLWRSADADYRLPTPIASSFRNFGFQGGSVSAPRFALRILAWHDRISHGMSSDGKHLFIVEGLDLTPYGQYSGLGGGRRNIQLGNKSVEDPRAKPGNSIVARDVRTGQVLWRAGKYPLVQKIFDQLAEELESKNIGSKLPPAPGNSNSEAKKATKDSGAATVDAISEEEKFLGETWFLGPPLPLYGRLNVIGENAGVLRLFVLDAQNGKLIRQQPLLQSPVPFENDFLRRYYGLTPSAANGILLCPTGLGMVVALDATTAAPLWCFSYLTPSREDPNARNNFRNMRSFHYGLGAGNDEFRTMFAQTGWQIPSLMVDGSRLLVAPPDVPALYCLDLATGKLLWQKENLKHQDTLYVACIRNGKVYVVTPISMLALSLEDGKSVWKYSLASVRSERQTEGPSSRRRRIAPMNSDGTPSTASVEPTPNLVFPKGVVPSGYGVHNDNRYFLPLSDGTVADVDLDKGTFETVVPLPTFSRSGPSLPGERTEFVSRPIEPVFPFDGNDNTNRADTPPPTFTSSRNDTTLGNLVGLQGLFFSQAPLRITCFDQFSPLKKKTAESLANNPNDPTALAQLGRIRRAEGNISEAIALFRRSLEQKKSDLVAVLLRETLLEAIRNDYAAWNAGAAELESLAEFPEELGEILFVLAQGAAKAGKSNDFLDALKKSFRLETTRTIHIPIEDGVDAQLNRAFGTLIEQRLRPEAARQKTSLLPALEQVANELFNRLTTLDSSSKSDGEAIGLENRFQPPWWEATEASNLPPEIRRWQLFMEYFHSLPIASQARENLLNLYEKNGRFSSMESMLNPPVFWFPTGLDLPGNVETPPTGSEPVFFGATGKPTTKPTAKPLSFAETRRMAELLESQGNAADAFHYYRQLELFHADERDGTVSGKDYYLQALNRPLLQKYYEREVAPKPWPDGNVEFPEPEASPTPTTSTDKDRLARLLRMVQLRDRQTTGQVAVPLLGSYEPFHSSYTYSLETTINDSSLVCYDTLGTVRWRCDLTALSPGIQENGFFHDQYRGFAPQQMFLKGCNHYLLFVRRNTMIALDTFRSNENGSPTVLWTKTLTAPLLARQNFTALRLSEIASRQQVYLPWGEQEGISLGDPVHLLPNVVCYRDGEMIYGIEPSTGETLWSRDVPSFQCTILSDHAHLFLFLGETNRVLALDPGSGKELARGTVPEGAFFTFETNLIGCSMPTNGLYKLFVCDLNEVFVPRSQREQALLVSMENTDQIAAPTIASQTIRDNLLGDSILRFVNHQRFLATLPKQSATLKIYDLKEKTDYFGEQQGGDSRAGVKLSTKQPESQRGLWDLDIEMIDGNPLVLFIENPNVDNSQKNDTEDGITKLRSRGPLNNIPNRAVGSGTMMLYDRDGKTLWTEAVSIKDWYRLTQTPRGLPVILFGVAVTDQPRSGQPAEFSTALCGIDKKTGKTRFSKLIPQIKNQQNTLLQGFRVAADPERYEISFIAPFRTQTARFLDGSPGATPPKIPEPAEPKKETKPFNPFNLWPFG